MARCVLSCDAVFVSLVHANLMEVKEVALAKHHPLHFTLAAIFASTVTNTAIKSHASLRIY